MSDILDYEDLIEAKKDDTFHAEVITGKAGGATGGANIDYATHARTGQVQKTLPKTINDLDWSYVGKFVDGVTFTKQSDFAIDGDGTQWIYVGADPFPKTVPPAAVPSAPDYQAVHVGSLQALSGLTEPSDLAQRHRIKTTAAEITTGVFSTSGILEVTDRGVEPFDVVAGGTANGLDILNAGTGKTAQLKQQKWVTPKAFGALGGGADDTAALVRMFSVAKYILIDDDYVFKSNLRAKSGQVVVCVPSKKLIAGNPWVDSTGGADGLKRGLMNIVGVEGLYMQGLTIEGQVNSGAVALCPYFIRDSSSIRMIDCSGTHSDDITTYFTPYDIERNCQDIVIDGGVWRNETGDVAGGCWVRNISESQKTERIVCTNGTYLKDCGDEVVSIYGVFGLTRDVEFSNNTIINTMAKGERAGTLLSVFPLKADAGKVNAAVTDIRVFGNTLYAGGFTDSAVRVGRAEDSAQPCNDISIYDNTVYVTNCLPTADVVRFIKCQGDNVSFDNNTVRWLDTNPSASAINGRWASCSGNYVDGYADFLLASCNNVQMSKRLFNRKVGGALSRNCAAIISNSQDVSADVLVSNFGYDNRTVFSDNVATVTGVGNVFSSNSTTLGHFIVETNEITTTAANSNIFQMATGITTDSICRNNVFKGVACTEYFTGASNQFADVANNDWWGRNDERNSVSPYTTYGYNRMMPLGKFVYNNNIGATTGTVTLGWSKQEINAVAADWKAVKATI